jgi:hypothetical protein
MMIRLMVRQEADAAGITVEQILGGADTAGAALVAVGDVNLSPYKANRAVALAERDVEV